MRDDRSNPVVDLTFEFALKIIEFSEKLQAEKRWSMADQVFRSGTAIGSHVKEAQNAESRKDFIHEMKIAAKEADETEYRLSLCQQSPYFPNCQNLIDDVKVIIKLLSKIISTSKKNMSVSAE